jgi:hypothetical protein
VGIRLAAAHETTEFTSYVIVMTLCLEALRDFKPAREILVGWVRRQRDTQFFNLAPNGRRFPDASSPENDDRMSDGVLLDQTLRFEIIELETHAADIIAIEELHILIRLAVAGAFQNGLDSLLRFRIFLE